jgi:hypothetical protein
MVGARELVGPWVVKAAFITVLAPLAGGGHTLVI